MENPNKISPLYLASKYGHNHIVDELVEYGAKVNIKAANDFTPMHEAAMYGHADVVESLILSHGNLHEICDQTGITPLHLAAKHMHFNGMY